MRACVNNRTISVGVFIERADAERAAREANAKYAAERTRRGRPALDVAARFARSYRVDPGTGCWAWLLHISRDGYGRFRLGARADRRAHRVSYELHRGPVGDALVCHHCDNPACVNPAHLFLGTPLDNMLDKVAKGRAASPAGEANPHSKLTAGQVLEIRARAVAGEKAADIARSFPVQASIIGKIIRREIWKEVA